jgi:release factor glutamine methyltransferase
MNRSEARLVVIEKLKKLGLESLSLEADLLCMEAFGCSREALRAHLDENVTPEEETSLLSLAEARESRKPMAYIRGRVSFWGMDFVVGPGCLVPRPETELLVEEALGLFTRGRFLDWGTGSGCVGLSILGERPDSSCLMLEKSPSAIRWAWRNLKLMSLFDRALLWHGSGLGSIPSEWTPFDLIVGNPPYIPSRDMGTLMPDVRHYEPLEALDGGHDGLQDVRQILSRAGDFLAKDGYLLLEIGGPEQVASLAALETEGLELVRVRKDLAGTDRIVVWRQR